MCNTIFGSEALASPSCFDGNEAFGGAKAPLPMKCETSDTKNQIKNI